jgi:hypothetical protein
MRSGRGLQDKPRRVPPCRAFQTATRMKDKPIKEPRSEQERLLDEALAETFPASDPISVQQIVIVGQVERPLRGGGGGGGGSGAKTSGAKTSGAKTSGAKTSGVGRSIVKTLQIGWASQIGRGAREGSVRLRRFRCWRDFQFRPPPARTARVARSGPKSSTPSMARRSASRVRARLTRLLMVPTAQPQIAAASS